MLFAKVSEILWKEWDPIGVYDPESEWDDEYDNYVPVIVGYLLNDRDLYKISSHLVEIEINSMGFDGQKVTEHHKNIAQKLIDEKNKIFG